MNKYQKALNIFCEQNTFKDISKDVLEENYKLLKELVEKATPKKPFLKVAETMAFINKYDGHEYKKVNIEGYHCPTCGKYLCAESRVDNRKPIYCRECGQALEWSYGKD